MRCLASVVAILLLMAAPLSAEEPPADALRATEQQPPEEASTSPNLSPKVHSAVARLAAAESPDISGEACRELFFSPHAGYLRELTTHPSDHVALPAAWSLYNRTIPRRDAHVGPGDTSVRFAPDLQRFVGFLEGRLRVAVPRWWETALEELQRQQPSDRTLPGAGWQSVKQDVGKVREPLIQLTFPGNSTVDRIVIPLPTDAFSKLRGPQRTRLVAVTGNQHNSMLLKWTYRGSQADLLCFDPTTGAERWRSQTWGLGPNRELNFVRYKHYVSLVLNSQQVVVFGATLQGAYVEAFDLKDGTCVARFATTNWFVRKDDTAATDN